MVLGVSCTPWRYEAGGDDEYGLSRPVNIGQIERGEVPKVKPFAKEQRDYKFRAFYVLRDVVKQCGITADCVGCKFMLMNQGGKPHSDECRRRVMRWMALSENSRYRDRLGHWTSKVQHYFDVCGDAFNNVTLTDFSEPKNVAHPEPTSPAVHLSPDP